MLIGPIANLYKLELMFHSWTLALLYQDEICYVRMNDEWSASLRTKVKAMCGGVKQSQNKKRDLNS